MLFLPFNPLWALFIGIQLFFVFAALFFLLQSKLQKQKSQKAKESKHYTILLYAFLFLAMLSLIAGIVFGILYIIL